MVSPLGAPGMDQALPGSSRWELLDFESVSEEGSQEAPGRKPYSSELRADGAVGTEPAGPAVPVCPPPPTVWSCEIKATGYCPPCPGPQAAWTKLPQPYLKPNTLCCSSPEHDSAFQEPLQSVWVFVNLRKKRKKKKKKQGRRVECGLVTFPSFRWLSTPLALCPAEQETCDSDCACGAPETPVPSQGCCI